MSVVSGRDEKTKGSVMVVNSYRDLEVWQKPMDLVVELYSFRSVGGITGQNINHRQDAQQPEVFLA